MAENNQDGNANNQIDQERYKELEKLIGVQESRIQNLQTSAFQLANYYFIFQGVVLAAISNTTSLTCSDSWFIFTLSLLAAILNLFALFSIGSKYIRAMDLHEQTWSEFNASMLSLRNQTGPESLEFTGAFSPGNSNHRTDQRIFHANRQWRDHFSQRRRYVVLGVCMVLFLAFTGVTLSGPWRVICKHDNHRKHPYGNMDHCLKLCNGSRCMTFCQDS